ncbi:AzlD domain-containing protein [Aeromonas cavernicola]|uniref:Branched-chain amino acid ABC transporter n=1 Tax=Aeromonas cavernicola TaxID=1006623 RepID=A0A2H9U9Q2_9GAMM|nr:AzlD domain-containing protein [Aeromonas cavernicola]PJG60754.1 branched-chain amino acid ABC transporter [Aeromonas cavernicola]
MILLAIFAMSALVFASRYFLLEPALPLRLGTRTRRLLSYAMPAVLTALWGPIVMMPQGTLALTPDNPALWGALAAALIAWRTGSVLMATLLSLALFLLLGRYG